MTEEADTSGILKRGLVRSLKWGGGVALSGFALLAGLIGLIFLGVEDPEERSVWMMVLGLSGGILIPIVGLIAGILTGGSIMAASAVEAATQEEGAPPASQGKRCLLSCLFFIALTAIACPVLGWYFDLAYMQPRRPPSPSELLVRKILRGEVESLPEGSLVAGDEHAIQSAIWGADDAREVVLLIHALSDLRSEYALRIIKEYLAPRWGDSRAAEINPGKAQATSLLVVGFCDKPTTPELQALGVECLEALAKNPKSFKLPPAALREQVQLALAAEASQELQARLQKILASLPEGDAGTGKSVAPVETKTPTPPEAKSE